MLDGYSLAPGETVSPKVLAAEQKFVQDLSASLKSNVLVLATAGRSLADGIVAACAAHCHLSQQGSSTTKSILIANLPGVVIGPKAFKWNVRGHRLDLARFENLQDQAIDVDPTNIQTDFALDSGLVLERLVDVIDQLASARL